MCDQAVLEACVIRLRERVAKDSQRKTARELGISNATVSLLLAGKYPNPERMVARIAHRLGLRLCPAVKQFIEPAVCLALATPRAPLHNPLKLAQWKACRACQHSPAKE